MLFFAICQTGTFVIIFITISGHYEIVTKENKKKTNFLSRQIHQGTQMEYISILQLEIPTTKPTMILETQNRCLKQQLK
jgi:hypothetical protein